MKIVSIVGARPQFIKVKPISDIFKEKRGIKHILIHTGQHYDYEMSKIFFEELHIPKPNYNLMVGSHPQGEQTGLMIQRIEKILLKEKPDIVIVYGDTNSTLAGALSAVKLDIKIAHVEAGLRSYRRDMPEEINRVLTDHISSVLFCPTSAAVKNLKKENITKDVYLVGDVMYDVFLFCKKLAKKSGILSKLNLKPREYLVLTIHRKENTDKLKNLTSILSALIKVREKIIFPVHPRTWQALKQVKLPQANNIIFIQPVSYLDMVTLETNAKKILTDSGGVQKEAYWARVPCITLREETEWGETLINNCNCLVGAEKQHKILEAIKKEQAPLIQKNYFGDGKSARIIVKHLSSFTINK